MADQNSFDNANHDICYFMENVYQQFQSIVIATHTFSPGTAQKMRDYLLLHGKEVIFIGHKLQTGPVRWTLGAVDTIWRVVKTGKRWDLFFGSNNLNAFVGILLKSIGMVKKVIYFTPDYSHHRFKSRFLSQLWHRLDKFCVKRSNITWDSSIYMEVDYMVREREKRGYPVEWRNKQIAMPDGTDPVEPMAFEDINRYQIGFVGHLKKGMGVDLLIDIFPELVEAVPEVNLLIIGSGPIEEELKRKAKGKGNITFTGFMGDIDEVYNLLKMCAIGVAPYEPNTISQYTDSGKVRNYLTAGIPMVVTKVAPMSHEIERRKCGFAVEYKKGDFLQATIKLLNDESLLRSFRENVKEVADDYRWDKTIARALAVLYQIK